MNLASRQVAYAARLARYPGELLYEEMHKLFSLSDEVESMLELDMSLTLDEKQDWLSAIRERLEREPEKARLVAEDTAKGWNADWWWHSTLPAQARR
ncbi:MAG: hypothetical protein DIJKHBIC_01395 [Thermoanaerobaculia bacterium]|nr:hypothetical protein [Thermoanaerobaculia bacterium]